MEKDVTVTGIRDYFLVSAYSERSKGPGEVLHLSVWIHLPVFSFAVMEVSHKKPDSSLYEAKEASSVGETRREKH